MLKKSIIPLDLKTSQRIHTESFRTRHLRWANGFFLRQTDELDLSHAIYRSARREGKGQSVAGRGTFYWRLTRHRAIGLHQQRFATTLPASLTGPNYKHGPTTDDDRRWWDRLFQLHAAQG